MTLPVVLKEKQAQSQKLFDDAAAILQNPESTAEEKAKVDPMLEEAKTLQKEFFTMKEIDEAKKQMSASYEAEQPEEEQKTRRMEPAEFKDWGDYLQAVHSANHPQVKEPADERLEYFKDEGKPGHQESKVMGESTGAGGGFLVPSEFLASVQAAQAENSIVRSRATIIRMRRRQIDIPVLDQTGTTANIPHWFGGMQFYWAEEATEKTATDAAFRQVQLVAHKLIGYSRASDELVDDAAISLGDFFSGPLGFAGGLNWMEDYAFLRGSGAGQPLGVINAGATITVNRQSVATPIQWQDLVNMYESFLPTGTGVWIFNQSCVSNLLTMQDGAGNYIWLPNPQHVPGNAPGTILGMPVIFTEKTPTVGNAGDVLLADWSYYLIGDRQATTIESTQYDYWRYDQTSWRAVHRVDGQPWLSAPLTLADGTQQISPFVILGAKST